jgi:hypothetical protein
MALFLEGTGIWEPVGFLPRLVQLYIILGFAAIVGLTFFSWFVLTYLSYKGMKSVTYRMHRWALIRYFVI